MSQPQSGAWKADKASGRRVFSVADIKGAHSQKKDFDRQFPLSYFVVRQLSFYLSHLLLKITHSPSRVAYWGLLIGVVGCLLLVFIPELTPWPGLGLLVAYVLFDAADGNIARVTDNVTSYGRFLDALIGDIVEGSYFFWIGLGLYRESHDLLLIRYLDTGEASGAFLVAVAGAVSSFGRLYSHIMRGYYFYYSRQHTQIQAFEDNVAQAEEDSKYRKSWWYLIYLNLGSIDLQLLFFGVCAGVGILDVFLIFYAVYYFVQSVLFMVFYVYKAQRTLY
ncbi:MAG: CDP-alcohol phosphatidyltransferase family protein [Acidobacteria bacterium]|nr:CDP-alcohol phosphatidyltransferase family protein [Acidobacteriota bacterium]